MKKLIVCVDAHSKALGRFAGGKGWVKAKAEAVTFDSEAVAHQWAFANVGLNVRWQVCPVTVRTSLLMLTPPKKS